MPIRTWYSRARISARCSFPSPLRAVRAIWRSNQSVISTVDHQSCLNKLMASCAKGRVAAAGQAALHRESINTGNSRIAEARARSRRGGHIGRCCARVERHRSHGDGHRGSEVAAMRGDCLARQARNLYVEFAPWQLREQRSSAPSFWNWHRVIQVSLRVRTAISFLGPGRSRVTWKARDRDAF